MSTSCYVPFHSRAEDLRLVWIPGCPWKLALNTTVLWVPEGNLTGNFRADFRQNFGQTWPPNPSRSTGLVLQCRLHHKSAPQTNILTPFRGTNNFRQDCLQVPRCPCRNGTFYCDSVCQNRHWPQHRRVCAFEDWRRAVREVALLGHLDTEIEARLFQFLG